MPAKIKMTSARRAKIANYIAAGVSQKAAFSLAGINHTTGAKWITNGKNDIANGILDSDEAKLVRAIEDARAALEHTVVQKIKIVEVEVDAFTFLKYLRDQEAKRELRDAEASGGLGTYTPPPVAE